MWHHITVYLRHDLSVQLTLKERELPKGKVILEDNIGAAHQNGYIVFSSSSSSPLFFIWAF